MHVTGLAQISDIEQVILATISADFENVKILDVNVLRDVDFDGDDVLKVEVIFEGTKKDLDARKVSGALRHVRPKLSALGETGFPLLSFISSGERGFPSLEPA